MIVMHRLNAHRAPGPTGVFVMDVRPIVIHRWPGWPANDNDTRGRRTDLDPHYPRKAARR